MRRERNFFFFASSRGKWTRGYKVDEREVAESQVDGYYARCSGTRLLFWFSLLRNGSCSWFQLDDDDLTKFIGSFEKFVWYCFNLMFSYNYY